MSVFVDLLRTKLSIIDGTCESNVASAIDKFYSETKYDGGRFHVPPFQDVANALLRGISCKEREFNAEIGRIMAVIQKPLEIEDFEEAKHLIEGFFDERHYRGRLNRFIDGIKRKATSYGISFDPTKYRVDIAEGIYEAGLQNLLRQARSSVTAELVLHKSQLQQQKIGSKSPAAAMKAFWTAHWEWIICTVLAVVAIAVSL